ncbi:MAG TPA: hypothetical protein VGV06_16370 [Methylomirabilota bacterium]|nr:hypothetical protein [Methylomirabilota bacterium]
MTIIRKVERRPGSSPSLIRNNSGTEGTKAQVESGEFNRKIDARIAEIKSTCGVQ